MAVRKLIVGTSMTQLRHRMDVETGHKEMSTMTIRAKFHTMHLLVATPNDERVRGMEFGEVEFLLGVPLKLREQYLLRKR